jgi:hypothetical protein
MIISWGHWEMHAHRLALRDTSAIYKISGNAEVTGKEKL